MDALKDTGRQWLVPVGFVGQILKDRGLENPQTQAEGLQPQPHSRFGTAQVTSGTWTEAAAPVMEDEAWQFSIPERTFVCVGGLSSVCEF